MPLRWRTARSSVSRLIGNVRRPTIRNPGRPPRGEVGMLDETFQPRCPSSPGHQNTALKSLGVDASPTCRDVTSGNGARQPGFLPAAQIWAGRPVNAFSGYGSAMMKGRSLGRSTSGSGMRAERLVDLCMAVLLASCQTPPANRRHQNRARAKVGRRPRRYGGHLSTPNNIPASEACRPQP